MITRQLFSRYVIYLTILAILLTACAPSATKQTETAVIERARFTLDGIQMQGGAPISSVAGDLWAIAKATENATGTLVFYEAERQIVVCLAEGGPIADTTARFWRVGVVDVAKTALMDAGQTLATFGIDIDDLDDLEQLKAALRLKGFVQFSPESIPLLVGAVRLGIGFLRSLGTSISDVLIMPVYMVTPEMLSPWCIDGTLNCTAGRQE